MIYIFSIFAIYFINQFFKKKSFLVNNTGQPHQILSEKKIVPLTGGIFLIIFFLISLNYNYDFLIFISVLFLIGIATDLEIIKSPSKRILIQIFFIFIFIFYFDLSVNDLRIDKINLLLENDIFSFLFTSLCFLVLINGSNFIDGNNGITLGYYLIIFIVLFYLSNDHKIIIDQELVKNLLIFLTILLAFNLLNHFYLGDSGVYLISIFSGYFLINLINQNNSVSPYLIANLLWYPSFELLFSMIRKLNNKFSPLKPDTNHLHQLTFKFLVNNFKFPRNYINSLTGLSINTYNLLILFICSLNYSSTDFQIILLLTNIVLYVSMYYFLKKKKIS